MTVELRARQAASAVHAAVEQIEPRALPVRRRFRRRRALLAIVFAILAPPAGLAVMNAMRDGGGPTDRSFVEDAHRMEEVDVILGPDTRTALDMGTAPDPDRATTSSALGYQPSPEEARRSPVARAPAMAGCDPLIVDAKGDVVNPAIDILESSITYDSSTNTLVIRHVIDDIPATPPFPNEALEYEYNFTLDGTSYTLYAYVGSWSNYEWSFLVQRYDRAGSWQWPNHRPRHDLMRPTGHVDTEKDTVTIEIDIDEFNREEGRVSAQEELPPAAELSRGSTLTHISVDAYASSTGAGPRDTANARCDYVVEEPT